MKYMNNVQRQQEIQQQMQFYQRAVRTRTINCSSNRSGNFVSTTRN
jgi:hypothetical protein